MVDQVDIILKVRQGIFIGFIILLFDLRLKDLIEFLGTHFFIFCSSLCVCHNTMLIFFRNFHEALIVSLLGTVEHLLEFIFCLVQEIELNFLILRHKVSG